MKHTQQEREDTANFYTDTTDPLLERMSTPLFASQRFSPPRKNWFVSFLTVLWRKINQLLILSMSVLILLLFIRFLIEGIHLSNSLFVQWTMYITDPLVYPFANMFPMLPYDGFIIDASTLVAIVIYALAITLLRQFLRTLLTNW